MSEAMWVPDPETLQQSPLASFVRFLNEKNELELAVDDYRALHEWSVREVGRFWSNLADFMDLTAGVSTAEPLVGSTIQEAKWFPGVTVNYAEVALRPSSERPLSDIAVVQISEDGVREAYDLSDLRDLVARVQTGLIKLGVKRGDVVAAIIPNTIEALVSFLATASIGAIWSSCSPEFGVRAIMDRFSQLKPTVLISVESYLYGGKRFPCAIDPATLLAGIPSLRAVVTIGDAETTHSEVAMSWSKFIAELGALHFEPVDFSDPLWVLFSSGTTGLPKGIVHSHGGIILEHWKNLRLHHSLGPGTRFFWFTTTGWMMWNYLVSGLLVGCTVILYDGSPTWPNMSRLWQLAADEDVTVFGVSAPFIHASMKAGVDPTCGVSHPSLQAIGSTGAPLSPEGFDWLAGFWGGDVQVCSTSGGTDVCTAFLISAPNVPVWRGELSCAALGVDARALNEDAKVVRDQVGELVLMKPLPSMPVGLWGDENGSRYEETYFSYFPGIWRHGDWCVETSRGSFVILGRSDATLNRAGIRTGTADFYRVVEALDVVADSLVVEISTPGSTDESEIWLFVVLMSGVDQKSVGDAIRQAVRVNVSPRHVPNEIRFVSAIPKTLNGKKCEVPVKRILMGAAPEEVVNLGSLQDPSALDPFVALSTILGYPHSE